MRCFPHPRRVLSLFLLFLLTAAAMPESPLSPGALSMTGVTVVQSVSTGQGSPAAPDTSRTPAPIPPPTPEAAPGEASPIGERLRNMDPSALLGLTIREAYSAFGVPDSIFTYRGSESWQDDVVFFYGIRLYLFWYADRVWQVRLDSRYRGEFFGLFMGMNRSDVRTVLGPPSLDEGDWQLFLLPDHGFPVRARLLFTGNVLSDVYIYRGDF